MPVRRRLSTRPIETSTCTTSRATVRETPYVSPSQSRVMTDPSARSPRTMRGPTSARTVLWAVDTSSTLAASRWPRRAPTPAPAAPRGGHGRLGHRQDDRGRRAGRPPRVDLHRGRQPAPAGQHREDVRRHPPRRRRPAPVAGGAGLAPGLPPRRRGLHGAHLLGAQAGLPRRAARAACRTGPCSSSTSPPRSRCCASGWSRASTSCPPPCCSRSSTPWSRSAPTSRAPSSTSRGRWPTWCARRWRQSRG